MITPPLRKSFADNCNSQEDFKHKTVFSDKTNIIKNIAPNLDVSFRSSFKKNIKFETEEHSSLKALS